MKQSNNILQELKELKSSLYNKPSQNIYSVPGGYFENLAENVMKRIRAIEAAPASNELAQISSLVFNISKEMPYDVPAGYFEQLPGHIGRLIGNLEEQTAREELESISPLLGGLKKQMPYSVPEGYFESLEVKQVAETKVVSIEGRKWFRYVAAAIMTGLVATTIFLATSNNRVNSTYSWVEKKMKRVSTDEINQFVQLADETLPQKEALASTSKSSEVRELIRDIPVAEIQNFLNDITTDETNDNDLMNDSDEESILN